MGSASSVSEKMKTSSKGLAPDASAKSFRSQRSTKSRNRTVINEVDEEKSDNSSVASGHRSVRITAGGGVSGRSKRIITESDDDGNPTSQRVVAKGSTSRPVHIMTDADIEERNQRRAQALKLDQERRKKMNQKNMSALVSKTVNHLIRDVVLSRSQDQASKVEQFQDSVYIPQWLSHSEADELFAELAKIGEKNRPKDIAAAVQARAKYPLWTKYYGFKRRLDGARALDRWGSYHEGWLRIEEPPACLVDCCQKLRSRFHLSDDDVNSVVVNYYYDGDHTYIPAHRDTTACLAEDSHVICLSLGAARDFILCDNADAGQFCREEMTIHKEWRVTHGDIFALGQQTNFDYCHAVPQEPGLTEMRISVIFRSVDKSFIELESAPKRDAVYSDGKKKSIAAECITCTGYGDIGVREHVADLVTERETKKKLRIDAKKLLAQQQQQEQQQQEQQDQEQQQPEQQGQEKAQSPTAVATDAAEFVRTVQQNYRDLSVYEQEYFASHVSVVLGTPAAAPATTATATGDLCFDSTAAGAEDIRCTESAATTATTPAAPSSSASTSSKRHSASALSAVASSVAQQILTNTSSGARGDASVLLPTPVEIGASAGLRTASWDQSEHSRKSSIITDNTAVALGSYYMGEGYAVPVNPRARASQS